MSNDKDMERAESQAKAQLESIREMVAALNLDWDRLAELREEREELQEAVQNACEEVDDAEMEQSAARRDNEDFDPDALDEACEAMQEAEDDLYSFGIRYGEELADLEADAGDCEDEEQARERIQEDPLSIRVRSCWCSPGEKMEACEFEILLCTGGPAVRIVGELGTYNEPTRAWLEYQDWFTPWVEYYEEGISDVLIEYSSQFYFGE